MSDTRPFAHLHCHTHFSMLDGASRIPEMVSKIKEAGMNSLAITDHGNLYGAMDFYSHCRSQEVNPILGLEAYIAPRSRFEKGASRMKEASFHLTLLAQNRQGFENLIKLSSISYLEGFYYKPRIDKEILEAHSDGLILLTGCAAGELSHHILGEDWEEAEKLCAWYEKVFGDRVYMEIQNAGLEIQRQCMEGTVVLANKMGLPLVAPNDAHYVEQEDAVAQDVLLCVSTRAVVSDEKRMKMTGDQFFVRTQEEMYNAFPGFEDAVARTQEVAERVDIQMSDKKFYPVFQPPDGMTDTQYLRKLCEERLPLKYGDELSQAHWDRLNKELGVIEQMGYSSYFLIVWDFVVFAESEKIPCTARGSACGAIVAFLLGMSQVCPLKYDLLFERFLDPSRTEPPDIDIDFCRDRRQLVIDYTKKKYGERSVAQIGTFGTLKAKAAIRDVGRALGVPLARVNEIAKMVPDSLGIKIKDAIKESPDLQAAYDQDMEVNQLLDLAMQLEGLCRSAGTHAAGVVVADLPLSEVVPLQTITGKTDIITQWDGPTVESVGLLKMDFLGLRNLTILDKAVQNVKKHCGIEIDPHHLPLDDEETFALLQRGETKGIFQLESGGMRDLLTKMKPDKFQDIIATSALYRPGPLEGGMVMQYVDVKHNRIPIPKVHPIVDEILEETYGVMVYQEQVMRILNRVGGIELSAAYRCIKAISKKKLKIIAEFKDQYIAGAKERDMDEKLAIELFDMIEKFAGYGFNKSHSTAYGGVAYATAYLKAHYPKEFMAALLSCGMESHERINEHVDDCRRMKIEVLPPDINRSDVEFSVDGEKIRFGMGAIKGVGEQALEEVVKEREENGQYSSLYNLCERVDPKSLNRSTLETLIKAGALNSLGGNQAQLMLTVERAVQSALKIHKDRARGQKSLFGDEPASDESDSVDEALLPEAEDWSRAQKLAAEKEVFGFYLTSHPLAEMGDALTKYAQNRTNELAEMEDRDEVILAGMVSSIKNAATKKPSKNGHTRYVNFDFEDPHGLVRCIMWPEQFARFGEKVKMEAMVIIKGKIDKRGREPNVIVDQLLTLNDARKQFTDRLAINFKRGVHTRQDMVNVHDVLTQFPGQTEVILVVDSVDQEKPDTSLRYVLNPPGNLRVSCSEEFENRLKATIGESHIHFHTPVVKKKAIGGSIGR